MKAILIKNTIVTLQNLKIAELETNGSGAKSNPYRYTIRLEYFSENRPTCIDFDDDKAKAIENFKAILSALNEKPSEN